MTVKCGDNIFLWRSGSFAEYKMAHFLMKSGGSAKEQARRRTEVRNVVDRFPCPNLW